jgi:hypothetical protein
MSFQLAKTIGQNPSLCSDQNCEKVVSAAHRLVGTKGMSDTRPQRELTKAGCEAWAQGVVLLDLYRGQLICYENTTSIFVGYEGRLQIGNNQRNSTPPYSHSELDIPVRFVVS